MTGARALTLFLCGAALLSAQRAQLGVKGRTRETTPSPAGTPVHKLPRRAAAPAEAPPSPLELELQRLRAAQLPPSALPADRIQPLVRTMPIGIAPAFEPVIELATIRTLPRRPEVLDSLAALLPAFDVPQVEPEAYPNRWRVPMPAWRRYDDSRVDAVYSRLRRWDPFDRNVLKGDYPLFGRTNFLDLTGISETLVSTRRIPVPSPASSAEPGTFGFFGNGTQFIGLQNFRVSMSLFGGSAGFKPVDYEVRITPEFNINYVLSRENAITEIDVRKGIRRVDTNVGFQELYLEKRLGTNSVSALRARRHTDDRGSAYFDFSSLRMGIQRFTSDFRGFIFSDEQPGARLFGTFHNATFQYNIAYFNMLEKDANTGLNRFRQRHQTVSATNLIWRDAFTPGFDLNFSLLYNNDQPTFLVDKNGFLVRPAPIGNPLPHKIRAGYAGISSEGHIGRINVAHAFYQAFGRDDSNSIPALKNPQHINAQLAALELSYEQDWRTYKLSAFFTSGDNDINDGRARGFDGIVPNQQFAGGGFLGDEALADRGLINQAFQGGGVNFLNRELVPLTGTGLTLFGLNSLMPTMRAGVFEGQANFINPGILLVNAGIDAKITPKLRSSINVNWARFHRTEVLEAVLFQSRIPHAIGLDAGLGLQYRPWLSENLVLTGGFGALLPGDGFRAIYTGQSLLTGFLNVRFLF